MEITSLNMDFVPILEQDIKVFQHFFLSSLAHQISNELAKEYQYVIDRFYDEYTPKRYKRHSSRGLQPGLTKTFRKYYKNPHNTIYYGGIEIDSDDMYNDYRDPKGKVLNSFLNGYHGRPSAGVESSLLPYKHMLRFREHLINELGRPDSVLISAAKDVARNKGSYSLIKVL